MRFLIYCDKDAKIYQSLFDSEDYANKLSKVVYGKLKAGPWRCDACQKTLKNGDKACVVTLVSNIPSETPSESDFFELLTSQV